MTAATLVLGLPTRMPELNVDDTLAALAAQPGTRVTILGDQFLLFARDHERMVTVQNGSTVITCTAKKAAEFGLFPND